MSEDEKAEHPWVEALVALTGDAGYGTAECWVHGDGMLVMSWGRGLVLEFAPTGRENRAYVGRGDHRRCVTFRGTDLPQVVLDALESL